MPDVKSVREPGAGICMPGSMSGEEKRSDGLLGERSNERRRAHLAPPVLYATALLLDSTDKFPLDRVERCQQIGATLSVI